MKAWTVTRTPRLDAMRLADPREEHSMRTRIAPTFAVTAAVAVLAGCSSSTQSERLTHGIESLLNGHGLECEWKETSDGDDTRADCGDEVTVFTSADDAAVSAQQKRLEREYADDGCYVRGYDKGYGQRFLVLAHGSAEHAVRGQYDECKALWKSED